MMSASNDAFDEIDDYDVQDDEWRTRAHEYASGASNDLGPHVELTPEELLAIDPTTVKEGSELKIQIMEARYEAGLPLWGDDEAWPTLETTLPKTTPAKPKAKQKGKIKNHSKPSPPVRPLVTGTAYSESLKALQDSGQIR